MKKSIDYILGIITGLAIAFAIFSSVERVEAHSDGKGTYYNPLWVKVVDDE